MGVVRRALLIAPFSLASLQACSLFLSTDDLAGGVGAADGGGPPSAVADGASPPPGPGRDAGAEASACANGGTASLPFCDDFERVDVTGPWPQASTGDGGSLGIGQDPDGTASCASPRRAAPMRG